MIHKTERQRPLETEEEHQAAIRHAERVTKKLERRAMWEKERHGKDNDFPAPREPSTTVKVFGWALGSKETPGEVDERRWEMAVVHEKAYHDQKAREAYQAANRQLIRRTKYREERDRNKAERQAMNDSGEWEDLRREKRRGEAFDTVQQYAKITGGDVSGWYDELRGELGEATPYRPTHIHHGGAIPRGKNPRRHMKPMGFPIN